MYALTMLLVYVLSMLIGILPVSAYITLHSEIKLNANSREGYCAAFNTGETPHARLPTLMTVRTVTKPPPTADPLYKIESVIQEFLYTHTKGPGIDFPKNDAAPSTEKIKDQDPIYHFPSGNIMGAQLFRNKSAVHLPSADVMHRGHCLLRVTNDLMQTALNAFAIILHGSLSDVSRLPPHYVLQSSRAISMMKLSREKFARMWDVVLDGRMPVTITIETLEKFRPLFKYLNGKQMARLNLTDERVLLYIGTHPDLKRHQMGVVASKYMKLNKEWSSPKYLNLMNNVLCGVPMTYMRKVDESTFLQLSHQLFYHVSACDPLQKRFYLSMMTKTQALGKSFSWSARDVSRLGLLLAEVDGCWLAAINPPAMAGITAQVMNEMLPKNLEHITELQLRYLKQKPLNIMAKKLKAYRREVKSGGRHQFASPKCYDIILPMFLAFGVK